MPAWRCVHRLLDDVLFVPLTASTRRQIELDASKRPVNAERMKNLLALVRRAFCVRIVLADCATRLFQFSLEQLTHRASLWLGLVLCRQRAANVQSNLDTFRWRVVATCAHRSRSAVSGKRNVDDCLRSSALTPVLMTSDLFINHQIKSMIRKTPPLPVVRRVLSEHCRNESSVCSDSGRSVGRGLAQQRARLRDRRYCRAAFVAS